MYCMTVYHNIYTPKSAASCMHIFFSTGTLWYVYSTCLIFLFCYSLAFYLFWGQDVVVVTHRNAKAKMNQPKKKLMPKPPQACPGLTALYRFVRNGGSIWRWKVLTLLTSLDSIRLFLTSFYGAVFHFLYSFLFAFLLFSIQHAILLHALTCADMFWSRCWSSSVNCTPADQNCRIAQCWESCHQAPPPNKLLSYGEEQHQTLVNVNHLSILRALWFDFHSKHNPRSDSR